MSRILIVLLALALGIIVVETTILMFAAQANRERIASERTHLVCLKDDAMPTGGCRRITYRTHD